MIKEEIISMEVTPLPSVFTKTNVSPEIIKICVFMWTLDNHGVLPNIQLLLNCKWKGL